jgi:hypothetical protein
MFYDDYIDNLNFVQKQILQQCKSTSTNFIVDPDINSVVVADHIRMTLQNMCYYFRDEFKSYTLYKKGGQKVCEFSQHELKQFLSAFAHKMGIPFGIAFQHQYSVKLLQQCHFMNLFDDFKVIEMEVKPI